LENPAMIPRLSTCRISTWVRGHRDIQRAGLIADRDHFQTEVMQFMRGVGADIAEPWTTTVALFGSMASWPITSLERCATPRRLSGNDLGLLWPWYIE
jgi:hypothetical protein